MASGKFQPGRAPRPVVYDPQGAARELLTARQREVVLSGPAGTGKSYAGLWKAQLALLARPGAQVLLVRKTQVSLTSTTLETWRRQVARESIRAGLCSWFGGSMQEAAGYRYTNGSKLTVGGMDKPQKIMSSAYDLIVADEATELTLEDWELATTRLRNGVLSYQQLIGLCNPSAPGHWLKQRCDNGSAVMLYSRHTDNPLYIDPESGETTEAGTAYLATLDSLTGTRRLRLRDGVWAAAEGLVYGGWDDAVHLLPSDFPIPAAWPRYLSIDFGFTNPTVVQWWAEDPDGRLYLYRELYRTQTLVEDTAREVKRIIDGAKSPATLDPRDGLVPEPRPTFIVADHDAEGRSTFERHFGHSTTAAHKAVEQGIEAVQARLRPQADGRPRLFMLRDARQGRDRALASALKPTSTHEEITSYVRPPANASSKPEAEAPLKENDHGMDAMRYMVAAKDLRSRPRIRVMGLR